MEKTYNFLNYLPVGQEVIPSRSQNLSAQAEECHKDNKKPS